jgi:hypothetical protein
MNYIKLPYSKIIRDRPFNLQGEGLWFFVSFRIGFLDNARVRIFFLSCNAQIFFQNSTLGYMTKTLNQIIFFPPPKSEYFFQQHWESKYFFRKKSLQVTCKWSFPNEHWCPKFYRSVSIYF